MGHRNPQGLYFDKENNEQYNLGKLKDVYDFTKLLKK
jgi:hypothetical protein